MEFLKFISQFIGVNIDWTSTGKNKDDIHCFIGSYDDKKKKKEF